VESTQLALGMVWYVCFLFSLTCHEASHALAAKLGGDLTAFHGGQVTLNPIPHMMREKFGTIVVPILSFALGGWMIGWASAPYDPHWQARHPHRAAWMALAGPLANFAIVIAAAIAIHLFIGFGVLERPYRIGFTRVVVAPGGEGFSGLGTALSILFSLNLLLGIFNLIPFPPLDGGSAIGLLMSEERARKLTAFLRSGPFAIVGILIAWRVVGAIFWPVFVTAVNLLYPGSKYG